MFLILLFNAALCKYITLDKDYNIVHFHSIDHLNTNDFLHIEKDKILKPQSIECNSAWGLDRINQESLPLDNIFLDDEIDYTSYGENVDVYVLDTGVNNHKDFFNVPIWLGNLGDQIKSDINGHGTHVAGTIAGKHVGVAYKSTIYSVKISFNSDGDAYCSDMVDAVNIVIENMKKTGRKSVINLSYGICKSVTLKLNHFMSEGGIANVAAGNDNEDQCDNDEYTIFNTNKGFLVGATNIKDEVSSFSNYGSCVEIYAPGSYILSFDASNDEKCVIYSGTSMATPMVTGVISAYWSKYLEISNDLVISNLKLNSIKNKLNDKGKDINNNLILLDFILTNPPENDDYSLLIALIFILILISLFLCICYINLRQNVQGVYPRRVYPRRVFNPNPIQSPHINNINNEGIEMEEIYDKTPEDSFDREMKLEGIQNSQEEVTIIDIPIIGYEKQVEELNKNPPKAFF